jgi:hypothetical protein
MPVKPRQAIWAADRFRRRADDRPSSHGRAAAAGQAGADEEVLPGEEFGAELMLDVAGACCGDRS